eukprot:1427128-Rhodomonas_salina.2
MPGGSAPTCDRNNAAVHGGSDAVLRHFLLFVVFVQLFMVPVVPYVAAVLPYTIAALLFMVPLLPFLSPALLLPKATALTSARAAETEAAAAEAEAAREEAERRRATAEAGAEERLKSSSPKSNKSAGPFRKLVERTTFKCGQKGNFTWQKFTKSSEKPQQELGSGCCCPAAMSGTASGRRGWRYAHGVRGGVRTGIGYGATHSVSEGVCA